MGSNQKGYKPLVDMDYKMWGPRACVRPVYTVYIITYIYSHMGAYGMMTQQRPRAPPAPAP